MSTAGWTSKSKSAAKLLKYTAQQMKFTLANADAKELEKYKIKVTEHISRRLSGLGT